MQRADVGLKPTTSPAVGDTGVGACERCGARGAQLRCGACRGVAYCSRACQAAAWPAHRAACQPAAATIRRARLARRAAARGATSGTAPAPSTEETRATTATSAKAAAVASAREWARDRRAESTGTARPVVEAKPRDGMDERSQAAKTELADDAAARREARKNKKIDALAAAAAAVDNAPRPAQPGAPARLRPARSLGHQYARWDALSDSGSDNDDGGGAAGAAALPLADRYGRWNGFDSVDESDDAPDDRDRRWCARHHRSHYGACPQCVNPSRRPSQPTPAPYVPRSPRLRDPDDVDAAMDDFEKKVGESKRAKDVLRQLKATIDGVPDAEVDVASCLSAIKTAAAYSPPESSLNELLGGTDPAESK